MFPARTVRQIAVEGRTGDVGVGSYAPRIIVAGVQAVKVAGGVSQGRLDPLTLAPESISYGPEVTLLQELDQLGFVGRDALITRLRVKALHALEVSGHLCCHVPCVADRKGRGFRLSNAVGHGRCLTLEMRNQTRVASTARFPASWGRRVPSQ